MECRHGSFLIQHTLKDIIVLQSYLYRFYRLHLGRIISHYTICIYVNKELMEWFVEEYPKHSKYKLDIGKSCIRFKRLDDILLILLVNYVLK